MIQCRSIYDDVCARVTMISNLVSGIAAVVAALVEAAVVRSELLLCLFAHQSLVSRAARRRCAGVALHAEEAALAGAWSEATASILSWLGLRTLRASRLGEIVS